MNKIHKSIWNEITGTFVAVAETAKAGGKRVSAQMGISKSVRFALQPLALALLAAGIAHAAPPVPTQLPTNGSVVAGQASISQSNAVMTITQGSNRAAVDWGSFNIGSSAAVNFVQPSASSAILNRVLDAHPSQILGRINGNGQVFLTNASGIYFGKSAAINVGALTATTHSMSNDDFMASRLTFQRNGATGSVVNEGQITAGLGGYIALLAPEVRNTGVVIAQLGTVALAAGEAFELQFDGARLNNVRVEPATMAALVDNGHAVLAPGGLIILSAQAANRLQGGVVNNTGRLEAGGLVNDGGTVRLTASDRITHSGSINVDAAAGSAGHGGTVTLIASLDNAASTTTVDGTISARGGDAGGHGGFVETSGGRVNIGLQSRVDTRAPLGRTGMWLLDPVDYTIAASGGDETGASVGASLALSDRTIMVADNIHVNDNITWSANKLTLQTTNGDVNINAVMTANNTASLELAPGSGKVNVGFNPDGTFKGRVDFFQSNGVTPRSGTGFLTINGSAYTVITALGAEGSVTGNDLQGIDGNLTGFYALGGNINASATSTWATGAGFTPIGFGGRNFSGVLNGLGHTINNLTINRPADIRVGLFSNAGSGAINNVGLLNASVTGDQFVGGLIGRNFGENPTLGGSPVSNSFVSGAVTGSSYVGGLIGSNTGSNIAGISISARIDKSYFSGTVNGMGSRVGGLIGDNYGTPGSGVDSATVTNSYATGIVITGGSYVGGLIGANYGGRVSKSYSSASVSSSSGSGIGGLIGFGTASASIIDSYATGNVSGNSQTGGLMGYGDGVSITNSHATGNVSGNTSTGGLVGKSNYGSISNSYATGNVSGNSKTGGLMGYGVGVSISRSYATGSVTGAVFGSFTGGLVGLGSYYTTISDSYATGNVSGYSQVGGLAGGMDYGSSVNRAYAAGVVTGINDVGGLIGFRSYSSGVQPTDVAVTHSFYRADGNTGLTGFGPNSGSEGPGVVVGMTVADLKTQANFTSATASNGNRNPDWNFTPTTGVWAIQPAVNGGFPCLIGVSCGPTSTPIYLRLIPGSSIFGNTPVFSYGLYTASSGGTLVTDATPSGTVTYSNPLTATTSVGTYAETYVSGLMLGNSAYTLYAGNAANWVINPRPLNVSVTKTYDGNANYTVGYVFTGMVNGNAAPTVTSGAASVSSKNVGSYTSFVTNTLVLSDTNYTAVGGTVAADITAKALTVTGSVAVNKVYDGSTTATITGGTLQGVVSGDAVTLAQAGSFANKNVGAGKAVTVADTLSGSDAGNYTLAQPTGLSADITAKSLTITGLTARDKLYDGTSRVDVVEWGTLTGLVGNETLVLNHGTASFSDTNAGTKKTVIASAYSIADGNNGGLAGNYQLAATWAATTATIQAVPPTAPVVTVARLPAAATPMVKENSTDTVAQSAAPTAVNAPGNETSPVINSGSNLKATPLASGITVSVVRPPSSEQAGFIAVSLPKEMAAAGGGFSFPLPAQSFETATQSESVRVSLQNGNALPAWLKFNPVSKILSSSAVPDGGFPIELLVQVGNVTTTLVISELAN
jgi:filamentous hemagglutinin family protein